MSIADNIKKIREQHNLTQSELGEIAKVSDKAVSSWEKGNSYPRMGAIERIAQHFGISKADIVEDIDDVPDTYIDKEAKAIAQALYDRPELMTLFKTTQKVTADDLKVIQQMVDVFANRNEE